MYACIHIDNDVTYGNKMGHGGPTCGHLPVSPEFAWALDSV